MGIWLIVLGLVIMLIALMGHFGIRRPFFNFYFSKVDIDTTFFSGIFMIIVGFLNHFFSETFVNNVKLFLNMTPRFHRGVTIQRQRITFEKCRVDLLLALDKYRNNCIIHLGYLELSLWEDRQANATDPKALFILERQYLLAFCTYRIQEFNNVVRPAVNQLTNFLLSQKNVSPERTNEVSQWMDTVFQKLQDLVDIVRVNEDYEALSSLKRTFNIHTEELKIKELSVLVLLSKLSIDFAF